MAERRPLEQAAAAGAASLAMCGRGVAIAGAGPSIAPTGIGLGTMVLLIAVAAVVDDAVGIVDGIFPGVRAPPPVPSAHSLLCAALLASYVCSS